MSTELSHLTSPRLGLLATIQQRLSRDEFFAGLFILGCANGLFGRTMQSVRFSGVLGAVLAVDINVVVLFACFAGISAILCEKRDEIKSADFMVAAIFLGLVVLPIFAFSWVAVTGLALYILLFASDGAERRRGAIILLALTVPMLWSRLMFQLFAKIILDIDAALVALLLGTSRAGNTVQFADGSGSMVVLAPCSSLANMSLAFLCWISITQWAKHSWSIKDVFWSMLACSSIIFVNVTRISLMGLSHDNYQAIHNPVGRFGYQFGHARPDGRAQHPRCPA